MIEVGVLEYLLMVRYAHGFIRSGNRPEFIAGAIKERSKDNDMGTLYINQKFNNTPPDHTYVQYPHVVGADLVSFL